MEKRDLEYLGDAVYASHDGYHIWLHTDDGNNQRIALDPGVWAALVSYADRLHAKYRPTSGEDKRAQEAVEK